MPVPQHFSHSDVLHRWNTPASCCAKCARSGSLSIADEYLSVTMWRKYTKLELYTFDFWVHLLCLACSVDHLSALTIHQQPSSCICRRDLFLLWWSSFEVLSATWTTIQTFFGNIFGYCYYDAEQPVVKCTQQAYMKRSYDCCCWVTHAYNTFHNILHYVPWIFISML